MDRTMKIDNEVATRLAFLKKKYRLPTYSDLLDTFCVFFETTNMSPVDINTSKLPASVLVKEGTSKIISFIKTNEKKYDKKMLDLIEKIYINIQELDDRKESTETPVQSVSKNTTKEVISKEEKKTESAPPIIENNDKELIEAKQLNEQLTYKINHQKKLMDEFYSKFKNNKLRKEMSISINDFQYYQNEFNNLW